MSAIGQSWEEVIAEEWEEVPMRLHRRRIHRALRHKRRQRLLWKAGLTVIGAFVAWELWKMVIEVNP